MIGSQEDAEAAVYGDLPLLSTLGSTRTVYLSGDVVYKVHNFDWGYSVNRDEYEKATTITGLPEGVYIPEVALYEVDGQDVIAMEYVHGTAVSECYCLDGKEECSYDCMPKDVYLKVKDFLDDTAGFNTIITENGDIYLIDLA